jgi:hypothetical protein
MQRKNDPAIDLLISEISCLERKLQSYKKAVNVLCANIGRPLHYPEAVDPAALAQNTGDSEEKRPESGFSSDAFRGKSQLEAVRELLLRRAAGNQGFAKPTEILEGLKEGGYLFKAKTNEIALVGLRAMLRSNDSVFSKSVDRRWGLIEVLKQQSNEMLFEK